MVIFYVSHALFFSQYLKVSEIIIFIFLPVFLGDSSEMQDLRAGEVV